MGKSTKDGPRGSHNFKPSKSGGVDIGSKLDLLEVQQYVPIPQNNEGMLLSKPSSNRKQMCLEKFGLDTKV